MVLRGNCLPQGGRAGGGVFGRQPGGSHHLDPRVRIAWTEYGRGPADRPANKLRIQDKTYRAAWAIMPTARSPWRSTDSTRRSTVKSASNGKAAIRRPAWSFRFLPTTRSCSIAESCGKTIRRRRYVSRSWEPICFGSWPTMLTMALRAIVPTGSTRESFPIPRSQHRPGGRGADRPSGGQYRAVGAWLRSTRIAWWARPRRASKRCRPKTSFWRPR